MDKTTVTFTLSAYAIFYKSFIPSPMYFQMNYDDYKKKHTLQDMKHRPIMLKFLL